eukprot:TRINITY_DN5805_c0_g1_i2.p1 TRINITY_DN5805_c0_g1~~TRINITY_DN5805_c0_g1_i2.p1  ORF type:complete len:234 (-),score=-19.47 TRINITY_DN5805_c0_g1_i2:69-770(-)
MVHNISRLQNYGIGFRCNYAFQSSIKLKCIWFQYYITFWVITTLMQLTIQLNINTFLKYCTQISVSSTYVLFNFKTQKSDSLELVFALSQKLGFVTTENVYICMYTYTYMCMFLKCLFQKTNQFVTKFHINNIVNIECIQNHLNLINDVQILFCAYVLYNPDYMWQNMLARLVTSLLFYYLPLLFMHIQTSCMELYLVVIAYGKNLYNIFMLKLLLQSMGQMVACNIKQQINI